MKDYFGPVTTSEQPYYLIRTTSPDFSWFSGIYFEFIWPDFTLIYTVFYAYVQYIDDILY